MSIVHLCRVPDCQILTMGLYCLEHERHPVERPSQIPEKRKGEPAKLVTA
jgi:hypothetical protein